MLTDRKLPLHFLGSIVIVILVTLYPMSYVTYTISLQSNVVRMLVPAVITLQNGTEIGVTAELKVYTTRGHGNVFIATNPIAGTDTEATARIAFLVATYLAGVNPYTVDAYISFNTSSLIIEGPSAGVAMTVALLASLRGDKIRRDVIVTGMVNPDGTVGPVGGLLAKLQAVAKSGAKYFLIPVGQRYTYVTKVIRKQVGPIVITKEERVPVDLFKVGEKLGVKVIEISTIREAYRYFTGISLPFSSKVSTRLPECIRSVLTESSASYLKAAQQNVNKTLEIMHLLSSMDKTYVKNLIKESENILNQAKSYEGLPYVYASKAFEAAITSTYALYSAKVLAGIDPETVINSTISKTEELLKSLENLTKITPNSYEDLEVRIAIASRMEMAKEAISKAEQLLSNNRILDNPLSGEWGALHEAAYAYWRAISVKDWSRILSCVTLTKEGKIEYSDLRTLAEFALYYASSIISYASSLLKSVGASTDLIDLATQYYNKAYNLLNKDSLYASIGYSLESAAYGVVSIDSVFTSNITKMVHVAEAEVYDALARLYSKNLTPPLSLSYLQFAEVQKKPVLRLYYLELSSFYMKMLYYASQKQKTSLVSTITTVPPESTSSGQTITNTTTMSRNKESNIGYVIASLLTLLLGLLAGIIIGRMSKS